MRRLLLILSLITVLSLPAFSSSILWDVSHGVAYGIYSPAASFSQMASHLGSLAYTLDTTNSGFLVDSPLGYSAIVVNVGSSYDSQYSAAEVAVIKNFVNAGGGLFLMADNPGFVPDNIRPVAQAFGFDEATAGIDPLDLYTSAFAPHPIFDGVSSIYMRAAGGVAGGDVIAMQELTLIPLVSVTSFGAGRVVLVGDVNAFDNNYRGNADNVKWEENIFAWLTSPAAAVPEPTSLLLLGAGLAALGLAAWNKRK